MDGLGAHPQHKPEDLSSDPQDPYKKLGLVGLGRWFRVASQWEDQSSHPWVSHKAGYPGSSWTGQSGGSSNETVFMGEGEDRQGWLSLDCHVCSGTHVPTLKPHTVHTLS